MLLLRCLLALLCLLLQECLLSVLWLWLPLWSGGLLRLLWLLRWRIRRVLRSQCLLRLSGLRLRRRRLLGGQSGCGAERG